MCITAVCVGQFSVIDLRCSACLLQNEAPSPALILEFQSSSASNYKSNYRLTKETTITTVSFVSPLMKLEAFNCKNGLIKKKKKMDNFTAMD